MLQIIRAIKDVTYNLMIKERCNQVYRVTAATCFHTLGEHGSKPMFLPAQALPPVLALAQSPFFNFKIKEGHF